MTSKDVVDLLWLEAANAIPVRLPDYSLTERAARMRVRKLWRSRDRRAVRDGSKFERVELLVGDARRLLEPIPRRRMEYDEILWRLQAGCYVDGDRAMITVMRDELETIKRRYQKGSDGKIGVGGFQKQMPMKSLAQLFDTSSKLFAGAAATVSARRELDDRIVEPIFTSEAARRLGVSLQTVHEMRRRNELSAKLMSNGHYIFDGDEVNALALRRSGVAKQRTARGLPSDVH